MKFITYFLLAVLGVVIGIAGYAAISPLLPDPSTDEDELYGGKSKEEIAAEFLASLEEEEGIQTGEQDAHSTQWLVFNDNLAFDSGEFYVDQQDAGGVSRVAFTKEGSETPTVELYARTGEDVTYEGIIDEAIYQRVIADKCFEFAGDEEAERTCFFEYLNEVSCNGSVGEMQLECYSAIPYNETEDRTYYFGQTVDFIYYIVVQDPSDAETLQLLESFDLYPEI